MLVGMASLVHKGYPHTKFRPHSRMHPIQLNGGDPCKQMGSHYIMQPFQYIKVTQVNWLSKLASELVGIHRVDLSHAANFAACTRNPSGQLRNSIIYENMRINLFIDFNILILTQTSFISPIH